MAGRKPRSTPAELAASSRRKRTIALADLKKAALYLANQTGRLEGLAAQMRDNALDHIQIDGHGLLTRGVDEVDRFIDNVNKGISQAKRDKERATFL